MRYSKNTILDKSVETLLENQHFFPIQSVLLPHTPTLTMLERYSFHTWTLGFSNDPNIAWWGEGEVLKTTQIRRRPQMRAKTKSVSRCFVQDCIFALSHFSGNQCNIQHSVYQFFLQITFFYLKNVRNQNNLDVIAEKNPKMYNFGPQSNQCHAMPVTRTINDI